MKTDKQKGSVIFLSHGGGPLPLLGDKSHEKMVHFMGQIKDTINKPDAIIVISAHWEENIPTIIGNSVPGLLYDYYGFPNEAYSLDYNLPGNTELAQKVHELLRVSGINSKIELVRGFDHGVFIPLMLMYPEGSIPTVQISLIKGLDSEKHVEMGKALKPLLSENILIIGSGFSFHNMNAFTWNTDNIEDQKNDLFQNEIITICTSTDTVFSTDKLKKWENLPNSRYCHPREEHLLPLHVCYGISESVGKVIFDDYILGKRSVAILWE